MFNNHNLEIKLNFFYKKQNEPKKTPDHCGNKSTRKHFDCQGTFYNAECNYYSFS